MVIEIQRLTTGGQVTDELADALVAVVSEVLAPEAEAGLHVRFGTWIAEDTGALQIVCKVESPADPFAPEAAWRWWSPLCDGPEHLRAELETAMLGRLTRAAVPRPARHVARLVATALPA